MQNQTKFQSISKNFKNDFDMLRNFNIFFITVVAAMVVVVVEVEIVGVEVVIEVTMVVEVTVVDTVVAHPLLITDPDPDVITDHALGLTVLVSTYYDPHWALFSSFFSFLLAKTLMVSLILG